MLIDIVIGTLAERIASVKRAFNAEFNDPDLDAFRPTNLLYPLATVVGYLLQSLRIQAREDASQATPFGATGANLDPWLDIYSVTVPTASKATGSVDVTGSNNKSVPIGTELVRADGHIFATTATINFGAPESTITVAVEALEVGASYNTAADEVLELALVDDDIDPNTVSLGIGGGSDPADDDAKKGLIKVRLSQSRIAGTAKFYEELALGFSSSYSRVFVVPAGLGPATVVVFPIETNPPGSEDWELTIPGSGEIAALQAHLEQDDVARVNDRIHVRAATLVDVDIDVAITPNTAAVQAAILDQLRSRFAESYAVGGYEIPNSEISGAISAADGEISHTLIDVGGGGAAADATAIFGEILQVGAVTFSAE